MSEFRDHLVASGNISFSGMRDVAVDMLPTDKHQKDKIYQELQRGKGVLDDDDHLNMYLYSFGKMHKAKLQYAFEGLHDALSIFSERLEIYDWGCGQGTATINMLDFLKEKGIEPKFTQINLIDPSVAAVDRATEVIECYDSCYRVHKVTKEFNALVSADFIQSNTRKVHLFSNILDVEFFDIVAFIRLFQKTFRSDNIFICVGPYYTNNRRVDEFIAAIDPDLMYAKADKDRGEWKKEWTVSLRVFEKTFAKVESIADIRQRIEDSQKHDQFFAGFILDAVSEELPPIDTGAGSRELFKSLCTFDVKSNKALNGYRSGDSITAVLANIISRGLPTKAPILIEETFSEIFGVSKKSDSRNSIEYNSLHKLDEESIFEAVHIIDPRLKFNEYNDGILESRFERAFRKALCESGSLAYLAQLLEPQRPLSSIMDIPNRQFSHDQRVDFAFEQPIGQAPTGFIVELDGQPYHSNIFQRLRDERRDKMASSSGWDTYRLENLEGKAIVENWEKEECTKDYLAVTKKNYDKSLTGRWNDTLQIVLAPLAIARLERILVEAIQSGALVTDAPHWRIAIIERDVPCGILGIQDFSQKFNTLCALSGISRRIPEIDLTIVSSPEFIDSHLHLGNVVESETPMKSYDICIDISLLLRDNIDALPVNVKADTYYIIRSAHYNKKHRSVSIAENLEYPALVTKDGAGKYVNIPEREALLTYFLQDIFRKPSFRTGQLPILSNALGNKTTIGLLPTGGGKSLTYQLSCILQPGVSIIVDPLVSLMIDQVRGLKDIGIDTCDCINATLTGAEKNEKLNRLQRGEVQFMLLSPERFMMRNFRESLINMAAKNGVMFAYGIIDEVHCVSEWGHDFRTSYLHLGRNLITYMRTKSEKPLSIIGLTATASFDVLADVERELTLGGQLSIDSEAIVRPEDDSRPELSYRVIPVYADFDELRDSNRPYLLDIYSEKPLKELVAKAKSRKLVELLGHIPKDIEYLNHHGIDTCNIPNYAADTFYDSNDAGKYNNAGIVFCPHAKGSFGVNDSAFGGTGIASVLMTEMPSLAMGTFVGGNKPSGDMKLFTQNDMNLMVATKAFGMGIDKPNIRFSVNYSHPSSIESYVQEAGRAGRDKRHAISYILYEATEFIHLTVDKISDICRNFAKEDNLYWLDNFKNKYVLREDFPILCSTQSMSGKMAEKILLYMQSKGYIENIDKNIDLWFHNNSFRGAYKEKAILVEMTDRIRNAKPTILTEVQGKLRDAIGNEDVCLKINRQRNSLTIVSKEDSSQQYAYIFLENLYPTFRYINFDIAECQSIATALVNILKEYPEHNADFLYKPLFSDTDNISEGIYGAMKEADKDGYVYVTVSWENDVKQDEEEFRRTILSHISLIAQKQGWENIDEIRHGQFNLNKIGSFQDLLYEISRKSNDPRWLRVTEDDEIFKNLKRKFSRKRDKDDTDKAIYRMCCVGMVEDVTIDYLSETYELKIPKKTDAEFQQNMLAFFLKYYSQERAEEMVEEINVQKGRNYLDKCLGYLTQFVYNTLKNKRLRAIEDIRIACEYGIKEREETGTDDWLKEFIHLYFNSKYARKGYMVGTDRYSLSEDIEEARMSDFNLVKRYIDIIPKDASGSEVDNVKHLYGATLLCLRAYPDNPALRLLLTYCITFLGSSDNETLKANALNGYIKGFMGLYQHSKSGIWDLVDEFADFLEAKVHDEFIKDHILNQGKSNLMLLIHEEELNTIAVKYLKKD